MAGRPRGLFVLPYLLPPIPPQSTVAQAMSVDVVAAALAALAGPTIDLETWEWPSVEPGHVFILREQEPSQDYCIYNLHIYTLALALPLSETRAPVIARDG